VTVLYLAGFEVGGANTMTATVAGSVATITPALYLPGTSDTSAVSWSLGTDYTGFSAAVKAAFDAATSTTFTVTLSLTTGLLTISRATSFTLAFSTAADLRLRAALGFTGNKSGANTYTSDRVPDYVMLATIGARTYEGLPDREEPDDVAEETISDGGEAEVVTRKTDEMLATWWQAMEPRAQVYRRNQTTGGWTWEDFVKNTRGTHPFVVWDSNDAVRTLHRFTAKGAAFRPKRVAADFSDYWNMQFQTRDLGVLA
jgi:hypothetical protein